MLKGLVKAYDQVGARYRFYAFIREKMAAQMKTTNNEAFVSIESHLVAPLTIKAAKIPVAPIFILII
jgi:hypothetical protein